MQMDHYIRKQIQILQCNWTCISANEKNYWIQIKITQYEWMILEY